jgi:hypothetical protein
MGAGATIGTRLNGGSELDVPDVRICPLASQPVPAALVEGNVRQGTFGGTAVNCWDFVTDANPKDDWAGSYAVNLWFQSGSSLGFATAATVKYPEATPLFADATWFAVLPQTNGVAWDLFRGVASLDGVTPVSLGAVIIARHGSKYPFNTLRNQNPFTPLPRAWGVNVGFDDGHATLVKLPDLWSLTWNRAWIPSGQP